MIRLRACTALPVMVLFAACAAAGRAPSGNPDVITAAEIERYRSEGLGNLEELVQRARPTWLRSRGERSLNLTTAILVYQDNQRLGSTEVLRDIPLINIAEVRWLDSARAGVLPGAGSQHVEGAIVIALVRQ